MINLVTNPQSMLVVLLIICERLEEMLKDRWRGFTKGKLKIPLKFILSELKESML